MFSRRTTTVVTVLVVGLVTVALVASALPVFAQPVGAHPAAALPAAALPAHAQLVSTSPEDGATVRTVDEVSVTFSDDVDARFVRVSVRGPGGSEADGDPVVEGGTVTQRLVADLPAGAHTVTYRVVSDDGHPVDGSFGFTTTARPGATAAASATPAPAPTATPTATRAATPTADAGGSSWALPGALLALVAVLAAAGVVLARRRPGRDDGAADGSDRADFTTGPGGC